MKLTEAELETAAEAALLAPVEHYLQYVLKRGGTTDNEHTLIAGNIRGFYAWLIGATRK